MRGKRMHAARAAAWALALAMTMAGCTITPYKIDIQQGNVVTQEMVAKLRQDMTRAQVRFVMGTPLVADQFHPNRWDYFYKFDQAGNPREQRRLTLVFENDKLKQVIGDVATGPGLARDGAGAKPGPAK